MYIRPANLHLAPTWYSEDTPSVSIVVLNFNKPQLTIECVKSVWEYTRGHSYEIIVVDNGSRYEEYQTLLGFGGAYKLLRLDINRYFGEGNNIGAEFAKGEFVLFMNNDVTVTPNWLPPLMETFQNHPDCGAAGPKFVYPNGLLQEAGALLDEEGGSVQIGKFQNPFEPRFNRMRTVDYVSAAAVLMKRKIFEQILGFDFMYEPAYYEDVDLCLKAGQLGLKTYYVPESCVVHHENATTADPKNSGLLKNIVAVNREKFIKRWQDFLPTGRHDGPPPSINKLLAAPMPNALPTAAIFTPYNIIPGGGERYLLATAEALIDAGYQVWLVTPEKYSYLRITNIAQILGLNLHGIGMTTLEEARVMDQFDVFFAIGNEVVPSVEGLGKRSFYCCQFPFPCSEWDFDRRCDWMPGYDALIVYSSFVKEKLAELLIEYKLPQLDIRVVAPSVELQTFEPQTIRNGIISVGRFFSGGHCKQQDTLIRAFRKLIESGVKSELHLVGSLLSEPQHRAYYVECQRLAEGLPVYFHVDASSTKLVQLYQHASIYWHGAGFGVDTSIEPEKCEHFGISVIEAMSAGIIPIVVNNGGPAITVEHGKNGFCYDTEESLIQITRAVLAKPDAEILALRQQAAKRAQNYTREAFVNRLQIALELPSMTTPVKPVHH